MVFGEEIRGKCGELFGRFFLFTSGGLGASRNLAGLRSSHVWALMAVPFMGSYYMGYVHVSFYFKEVNAGIL